MFSFKRGKKKSSSNEPSQRIVINRREEENIEKKLDIYAMSIISLMDIRKAIELLKSGYPILISFRKIRRRDIEKADEFLRRLVEFAKSVNGNLLGIGDDYIMISPRWIGIKKIDPEHLNVDSKDQIDPHSPET